MRFRALSDWLAWQETLHPWSIDLGLERCAEVARRLGVDAPGVPVFTVAGTNGKGSCVVLLEAMLAAAGRATGAWLSPHLLRYNERVRVRGEEVDDAALVEAFAAVDAARGDVTLTPFEFGTLAALARLREARVDALVLEVGLGGRLDAVNVLDADVAVITNVGIDHAEWLGPDREAIGREKAGILRPGRPAVYGAEDPPASVVAHAAAIGAPLHRLGEAFDFEAGARSWSFAHASRRLADLPPLALPGAFQHRNAAAAIAALGVAGDRIAFDDAAIARGLAAARPLAGRLAAIAREPEVLVDVAHNPHAAAALAAHLAAHPVPGRTIAVAGVLAGKDAAGIVEALRPAVDRWHAAGLPGPRGDDGAALLGAIAAGSGHVAAHPGVETAWRAARAEARAHDRIVAFGSFLTAATVVRLETAAACLDT